MKKIIEDMKERWPVVVLAVAFVVCAILINW